jgi:tripartite-type tricarboxylate transporter receptor subunit TctC
MKRFLTALALAAIALALPRFDAAADSAAEFYKGRQVFLQIGSAPGGSYDLVGRLFSRYMGKYIPGNPTIVVQNVPGGGSLALANQFGNTTPRDGTVFGVFNDGMPTTPLLDAASAHFDPRKFNFIGSPTRGGTYLGVWRDSPVKTYDDLFAKELILGATGPGAAPYDFPRLTNALTGTKFKIVNGYQGNGQIKLAMQRGEVGGYAGLSLNNPEYAELMKSGDIKLVAAFGTAQSPKAKEIPLLPLGKTAEEKQIFELMYARESYGRLFAAPPDVPADRVKALQAAFVETMKDPAFLAEAEKLKIDLDPVSAKELTGLTDRVFKTPPEVVARIQKLLAPEAK